MVRIFILGTVAAAAVALSSGAAWADTPGVTINATVTPGTTTYAYSTAALPAPGHSPADAQQMLVWANQTRATSGVGPLSSSDIVVNIAQGHSDDMARTNNLFHNDNYFTNATRAMVGGGILGENVAMGSTIANAQAAFLASPHHLANMVDARFNVAGFAVTIDNAGMYWVTEDFVQQLSSPRVAVAAPAPVAPAPPVTAAPVVHQAAVVHVAKVVSAPVTSPPATHAPPVSAAPAPQPKRAPEANVVVSTPALSPATPPADQPSPIQHRTPVVVGASVAAGLALALILRRKRALTV